MHFIDEPIPTQSDVISCDGHNPQFGHPKVYLNLNPEGQTVCPYCSQRFILEDHAKKKRKSMLLKNSFSILICCSALLGCTMQEKAEFANPASQYCVDQVGNLVIAKRGDGGEYGICIFEDNRQCEEWAMFRKECPIGGVKITGYTTPESIYCAIKGGQVLNNETQCKLPSDKTCSTKDLYNGSCS